MIPRKWGYAIKRQRKGILSYRAKAKTWKGAVHTYPDGREVCQQQTKAGADEYRLRRMLMRDRQRCLCAICGLYMTEQLTTFDHERGRGNGGAWRDDRILDDNGAWMNAAAHYACNTEKGSRRYAWQDGVYQPV
jgi:hypothetical protein